ncbi:hypothetical protein RCL1_000336 [Eukaryota sp. TZLM3-RCL]
MQNITNDLFTSVEHNLSLLESNVVSNASTVVQKFLSDMKAYQAITLNSQSSEEHVVVYEHLDRLLSSLISFMEVLLPLTRYGQSPDDTEQTDDRPTCQLDITLDDCRSLFRNLIQIEREMYSKHFKSSWFQT